MGQVQKARGRGPAEARVEPEAAGEGAEDRAGVEGLQQARGGIAYAPPAVKRFPIRSGSLAMSKNARSAKHP